MCKASVRFVSCLLLLSMAGMALGDLVGHWKFSEGAGSTANDSSGNGHHGQILGTPVWTTGPAGLGGALDFDPECTGVNCGVFDPTNGKGKFTLALWAFWDGTGTFQHFLTKSNAYGAATMMFQVELWGAHTNATYTDRVGISYQAAGSVPFNIMPKNQWVHLAFAFDGANLRLFLNGVDDQGPKAFSIGSENTSSVFIGVNYDGGRIFHGVLDDVRIYDEALPEGQIRQIMKGQVGLAADASPPDGATDVPFDTALGWTPGEFAATHDVYLGTVLSDVNDAGRGNPMGLLASQSQTAANYEPAGLEYGQTYYWRIDEVNAPPDSTVFKGEVWSFTVEPYGYPIEGVTATASGAQSGMGPENTVNGSGLNPDDQHSVKDTEMWLSTDAQPYWIQYEFDAPYRLHELWVWNSNQMIEGFVGFGARDVTIEYSLDGSTWTALEGVPEFARATGAPTYTANTTVAFHGVLARFVRLTINSNWGGITRQTGLSEVRFFYVPVQAREPLPADGAVDVGLESELNWRPGREAAAHEVLFGTDADAVAGGTVPAETVTEHRYAPPAMDFGTTYFWKVNEVNEVNDAATQTVWEGDLWSFTTREYDPIDDFESYNDDDNRIYETWIDGLTTQASGSQVGYDVSPFAERTIVHGGAQSMPLLYDNASSPFYSEAEQTFATPRDWTFGGADTLSLYFQGAAPAFAETAAGQILMNAIGTDIWGTADQFRFVYKTLSGDGTMVARVESVFNSNAWAKAGVMIRQSTDAGATHAFMAITPGGASAGNGASFQRRLTAGGASTNNDSATLVAAPYWVRIERKGNAFTGAISPDGATWTPLGTAQTIAMTNPVLIGLALCSHDAAVATAAEFSNVAATGNVTGAWQTAEVGVAQPAGNSAEPLYVTLEDSSGRARTVVGSDAAATARMGWQQLTIPLSEFTSAGVRMNAVKSITIGVGNRTAPTAGGTGKVFIDDIGFGHPAR